MSQSVQNIWPHPCQFLKRKLSIGVVDWSHLLLGDESFGAAGHDVVDEGDAFLNTATNGSE
jgi:hypothetical protein